MALDLWLIYVVASIGLSLTPGPNGLLALTNGARYGVRPTLFTICGGVVGFSLLMAISMAGMGALLTASQSAFTVAKWLGAAYLIYLGIRTWRAPPVQVNLDQSQPTTDRIPRASDLFSQGFFVAAANPKVIIFYAAFLPQFIDPGRPQVLQFAILAGTFAITEFAVELFLAGSARKFAGWLSRGRTGVWFNRVTGGAFIAIGGVLTSVNRGG